MVNFPAAYKLLYKYLDTYSGSQFIQVIRLNSPEHPAFHDYIEERRKAALSTIRRVYFWDILLSYDDDQKMFFFLFFLDSYEKSGADPVSVKAIRKLLYNGEATVNPD